MRSTPGQISLNSTWTTSHQGRLHLSLKACSPDFPHYPSKALSERHCSIRTLGDGRFCNVIGWESLLKKHQKLNAKLKDLVPFLSPQLATKDRSTSPKLEDDATVTGLKPHLSLRELTSNPIGESKDFRMQDRSLNAPPTADRLNLPDRFIVAQTISKAITAFHADGWVHKIIRSQSIKFFQNNGSLQRHSPYLVDFEYSRPETAATNFTYDMDDQETSTDTQTVKEPLLSISARCMISIP